MSGLFKMEKNVYSKWSDEWSANKTMIKIADIKELKLNITWKLLYRGLLEKQISINEIIQYAKEQLEKGDDRIEICELAGSSDYDLEDVMDTLYELAKEEKNPDDLEDRKLMGLTELWLELGCTADSPHIIQGKDNSISPVEYYTDANYNYLYEKNKHWLKDEVYFLIHNEK